MNTWWLLAIISGAGLATRNLSFKAVSNQIDAAFAALVLSIAMTVITAGYYIIPRTNIGAPLMPEIVHTLSLIHI